MILEDTTMVQRQITLSDDANEFIQQQLATGQFSSPDEVVSKTLEDARLLAAKKALAQLIREGINSGPPLPVTREYMDQRRAELVARLPPDAA
jgi:antitoxin ParD1/3/4